MSRQFIVKTKTFTYDTKYRLHFINITDDVEKFVNESGVNVGTITLQTHHTTCGLWVNEDEKNLVGPEEEISYTPDLKKVLDRFAAPTEEWCHNDICSVKNPSGRRNTHLCEPDENGVIRECINGHSHAQAMLLPCSITLVLKDGKLTLGAWQKILLVELDHDRRRQVTLLVQGLA